MAEVCVLRFAFGDDEHAMTTRQLSSSWP